MDHSRLSREEVARRGEELYKRDIGPSVEVEENVGKIVSIDVETGAFEIGDDPVITARRIQASHPEAAIWTKRIGYNAVYAVGGSLTRTTR